MWHFQILRLLTIQVITSVFHFLCYSVATTMYIQEIWILFEVVMEPPGITLVHVVSSFIFCLHSPFTCVCANICQMQQCQIASLFSLQCSLLRRLCNVITNHTWRAFWHSHKVRMKYEEDYEDLRLYYHDFLIIASLIYFCLLSSSLFPPYLSFFFPSNPLPVAYAEVEQKGKSDSKHTLICTCSKIWNRETLLKPKPEMICTFWQHDISLQSPSDYCISKVLLYRRRL